MQLYLETKGLYNVQFCFSYLCGIQYKIELCAHTSKKYFLRCINLSIHHSALYTPKTVFKATFNKSTTKGSFLQQRTGISIVLPGKDKSFFSDEARYTRSNDIEPLLVTLTLDIGT